MADKERSINSLNESLIDELNLVPLEERTALSPVGVLDVLVASAEILDANDEIHQGCPADNSCGANSCDTNTSCETRNCGAYNQPTD